MLSERFGQSILITDHARGRMAARAISDELLHDMIETGMHRLSWGSES
jgi:hypothetical protein